MTYRNGLRPVRCRKSLLLVPIGLGASLMWAATATVAPVASAATSNSGSPITNGCFNAPTITAAHHPLGYAYDGVGQSLIPGWSVGGDAVELDWPNQAEGWQAAPGCAQSVDLGAGNRNDTISQSASTVPGASYELKWEIAGDPNNGVGTLHVFWGGHLVAADSFNTSGRTVKSMGWAIERVKVVATSAKMVLKFAQANSQSAGGTTYVVIDAVSLTPLPIVVNGFSVPNSPGPYSAAERTMLAGVQGHATVPKAGTSVATLQAATANQVQNGAGLQIVWTIAPSAQYLSEPTTARLAGAKLVAQYLAQLLNNSEQLYTSVLKANRLPMQGADLAESWAVQVQSASTSGQLMTFALTKSGSTSTFSWKNVPGATSTAQSSAPQALANLLYYAKGAPAVPASTTTTVAGSTTTTT